MEKSISRREFVKNALSVFFKPLILFCLLAAVIIITLSGFSLDDWRVLGVIAILIIVATVVRWYADRITSRLSAKAGLLSKKIENVLTAIACFVAGATAWHQYQVGDRTASYFIAAITIFAVVRSEIGQHKEITPDSHPEASEKTS